MFRRAAVAVVGLLLLLIGTACAARAPRKPAPAPGSRRTCVAIDAANEPAGLAGERAWLHEKFPGWKMKSQGLSQDGDRVLDVFVVLDADGAEHSVCFDITAWFGKF
jgi:hypothetical protein